MRRARALAVSMALVAGLVPGRRFTETIAAGQQTPRPPSAPFFVHWPLPAADQAYRSIDGKHLWQYVKEQAVIAEHYRDQGHPQFWGRIAGTSSDVEDAQWLLQKYQQIGLTDAHLQTVAFFHPQWAPASWEVSATGGGQVVKLISAQPTYGSPATDGKELELPVVYVGLGSDADFAGRDVRGKAVLFLRATLGYNIGPADVLKRAEEKGAAALFGSDLRGGNYSVQAYRATTSVPTFQLGTRDALALRDLIAKAPAGDPPHLRVRLDARWDPNQQSFLVWGTLPGATDETIYVIAHRDGWFDAAGDNASGVASLLGLAEYFAKVPQNQRRRTMVFLGTDGHHQINPGGYGREWLVANREKFFSKTALMFNAEHPSQVLTYGGTNGWTEAVVPVQWYAGGPSRPELTKIAAEAFRELGVPLWAEPSATPPGGDLGAFFRFLPGVVVQSNDFIFMHTTGDTPENVASSGLEAATRAYAKIVDQVNKLPLSELQRPLEQDPNVPGPFRGRLDLSNCAEWVKDSSRSCKPNS